MALIELVEYIFPNHLESKLYIFIDVILTVNLLYPIIRKYYLTIQLFISDNEL